MNLKLFGIIYSALFLTFECGAEPQKSVVGLILRPSFKPKLRPITSRTNRRPRPTGTRGCPARE